MIELLKEFYSGKAKPAGGGGGGGSSDYLDLENKPQINDVTLSGNKTSSDLGLQDTLVSGTNIKTINNASILGDGNLSVDGVPNPSGNAGKMIGTDGESVFWENKDYYRSLSSAQATTLLDAGTYNGEEVPVGEIFTTEEGSFKEFDDDVTYGGDEALDFNINPGSYVQSYATFDFGSGNKGVICFCPGGYSAQRRLVHIDEDALVSKKEGFSGKVFNDGSKLYCIDYSNYKESSDGETWSASTGFGPGFDSTSMGRAGYRKALGKILLTTPRGGYNDEVVKYAYADTMNGAWTTGTLPTGVADTDDSRFFIYSDEVRLLDLSTGKIYSTTDLNTWTDTGETPTFPLVHTDYSYAVLGGVGFCWSTGYPFNQKVYYSTDRGATWNETNLPSGNYAIGYEEESQTWIALNRSDLSKYYTSVNGYNYSEQTPSTGTSLYGDGLCIGIGCAYTISNSGASRIFMGAQHHRSLQELSYNKSEVDTALSGKQDTLTAGTGIDITGNVISTTGGGAGSLTDIAEAGSGITFTGNGSITENFTVVGSPTITDSVAGNFSASNYLKLATGTFRPQSNTWEIGGEVTTGNDIYTEQYYQGCCSNTDNKVPLLGLYHNKFNVLLSSNGSSWDICAQSFGNDLAINTTYKIKLVFNGSKYEFFIKSPSDADFVSIGSVSTSTTIYDNTSYNIALGNNDFNNTHYFRGSLNLAEWYYKINNVVVWTPYTIVPDTKTIISADIGSGASAPTSSTEGYIGKLYVTSGGAVYICTGASGSTYTWKQVSVS